MAEETKKPVVTPKNYGQGNNIVSSCRAEIDTSPPFASVEEAVEHFGGKGSWIPHHLLRLAAAHRHIYSEEFGVDKLEEQAAKLENDLMIKERETLDVLKELEAAKRFVEGLKLSLVKDVSVYLESPPNSDSQTSIPKERTTTESLNNCPVHCPDLILVQLNQAKVNLNKTTNNLSIIRASVESLNKKMRNEKLLIAKGEIKSPNSDSFTTANESQYVASVLQRKIESKTEVEDAGFFQLRDNIVFSTEIPAQLDFEAQHFKNMTQGAKYEVMKAMSEIEEMKKSIDMVEMRLIAARKMEEAARAIEAIAIVGRKALPADYNDKASVEISAQKEEKIILPFDQYAVKKDEEVCKQVLDDTRHKNKLVLSKDSLLKIFEETTKEVKHSRRSLEEVMGETDRRKLHTEDGFFTVKAAGRHGLGQNSGKFRFRNSHRSQNRKDSQLLDRNELKKDKSIPVLRSAVSIGDILNKKLILQDNFGMGNHVEGQNERQDLLSQMLCEQSGLVLHPPPKSMKHDHVEKHVFSQRKRFGFIHVMSLPMTKSCKKKAQPSKNME